MELFDSKKTKGIKSHIKNLVAIAKSDGNFSMPEKRLIFEIGLKNGLNNDQLKNIIKSEKEIKFKIPKDDSSRFDQLTDLVDMMLADGTYDENEIVACIEIAEKLGFRKAVTGILVRKVVIGLAEGKSKEDLKDECGHFLSFNYSIAS